MNINQEKEKEKTHECILSVEQSTKDDILVLSSSIGIEKNVGYLYAITQDQYEELIKKKD